MKMGLGNCLLPERWKTQRNVSLAAFWLPDPLCPHQHLYCLSLTCLCAMTGVLSSSCSAAVHIMLSCLHLPSYHLCHFKKNPRTDNIKNKNLLIWFYIRLPQRQIKYWCSSSHPFLLPPPPLCWVMACTERWRGGTWIAILFLSLLRE